MQDDSPQTARVILIGGASGSGKSRIAHACGLPVLRLDDFYRAGDDPALPRLATGEVDWDHPDSWHADQALTALETLVRTGSTEVPNYDIAANGPNGSRTVSIGTAPFVVAEGIFVAAIAKPAAERGLVADAIVVQRGRWTTAALRFARDLREGRKNPLFLMRRGMMLAKREPVIIADLTAAGCRPMAPKKVARLLRSRATSSTG